jgi:cyanophycinase-like exopeptidase
LVLGFGMDEATALKVVDDELTVLGASGVYLIDMS